jgi:hypothetical protein
MHVEARQLRLTNIGQLIGVVANGVTTLGKLERVKFEPEGKYLEARVTIQVSGDIVTVPAVHKVNIKRSGELHELHLASLGVEDLLESAGVSA